MFSLSSSIPKGMICRYSQAMKTGFIFLAAAFLYSNRLSEAAEQYATVIFNTRVPGVLDAPVFTASGPAGAAVPGLKAQLYLVTGEGNNRVYTGLTPIAEFQKPTPSAPALAAYIQPPKDPILIRGYAPGTPTVFVLRVYDGPFYGSESSLFWAESEPFTVTVGGTNSAGTVFPDPHLVGLKGFTLGPPSSPCPHCPPDLPITFFSLENEKLRFDLCFFPGANFQSGPITNYYNLWSATNLRFGWAHFASGGTTQNIATLHFDPPTNSPIFFRNVRAISIDPSLRP